MAARILMALLGLTLILAVACGSAAPATPESTATQAADTAPAAEPTAAPVEGDTSQPTSTPQAAAPPAEVEVNPGKLTWMVGDFGNERFDATFAGGKNDDYARQIHAFLVSSDAKDGQRVLAPGIATQWEISSDGLTWTYTIRKGVKFHDGRELTPEDALWTLQHTIGPQAKDYAAGGAPLDWSRIMNRIELTGSDRVSVTTKVPSADFLGDISEASGKWIGVVLPKRATLHDAKEEEAYDRNPIGAGIVRLVDHTPAQVMKFERFDDFYYQPKNGLPEDRRVNFQSLDMYVVPEEATRVAALRAGEADIAPVSLASRQQVEAGGGRVVFGQEGVAFLIHQMGCMKPHFPCHDKRVRQALNYAIDKALIRDRLYGGPEAMQVKGWIVVSPSTIGYSPDLDPFPFDPNKARQLLAEAGYPGGKGFGKLIVNTWVSGSMPLMPEAAQLVAEFWKRELGLDVEVKVGDQVALKEDFKLNENRYGQVRLSDATTRIDAGGYVRAFWGNPEPKDRAHDDPELFALMQKALAVTDPKEQSKALNAAYRRMRDEAYWIPVGHVNIPWGVGPRVLTWQPYPLAAYPSALHTITLK
jgi:peptide/nickel transport system substrate-binding protein